MYIEYKFLSKDGHIKKGISHDDINTTKNNIDRNGYLIYIKPLSIKKIGVLEHRPIKTKQMLDICSILYLYTKSGMPISEGIKAVSARISNKNIRRIFREIYDSIINGTGIYESFKMEKIYFSDIFLAMIKIGEKSGHLEEVFMDLEDYYKDKNIFMKKMQSNLSYPFMLVIFMKAVFIFILGKVLPEFNNIMPYSFEQSDTVAWIAHSVSSFVEHNFIITIMLDICITASIIYCIKFFKLYMKIPIIKKVYEEIEENYFFQSFNMLYKSGITIEESMDILSSIVSDLSLKKDILNIRKSLLSGNGIYESFKEGKFMDEFSKDMVYFGEKTGELEPIICMVCNNLKTDIDKKINMMLKFIEPAVIAFIGIMIVSFIVFFVMPALNSLYYIE